VTAFHGIQRLRDRRSIGQFLSTIKATHEFIKQNNVGSATIVILQRTRNGRFEVKIVEQADECFDCFATVDLD